MKKRLMNYLLVILLTLINSFVLANDKIKGDLLIKNINVIDVKTGKVSYAVDVVISKDKISKIIKNKNSNEYEVSQTIDGTGKFIIPGLWDMHTHTWSNYKTFFPLQLANGVTGIREMFANLSTRFCSI